MKAKYGLLVLFSCSLIYPEGSSRSEILENKGTWVVDWSSLEEIPHSTTNLEVNGIVYGKKALPYTLRVDLHNWKPDKQTAQAESNIFGKDRRGKGGTNFELANIVLTVSDQRMAVVSEALRGILNLQIGEAMRVFFSEADHLTVLTVRGPDGAEGYEAAFIFKNGKFWRRQIRSNEGSSSTSWKLVQDMIYPNK